MLLKIVLSDDVTKIIGQVLGVAVISFAMIIMPEIRSRFTRALKDYNKIIFHNVAIQRKIQDIVNEILIRTGANRSAVLEFSNGEISTAGFPFNFLTMTYEKTDNNTTPIRDLFIKLPISHFIELISIVSEAKESWVRISVDSLLEGESMYTLQKHGMRHVYCLRINDGLKHGLVIVTFRDREGSELSADDVAFCRLKCFEIHQLMNKLKK